MNDTKSPLTSLGIWAPLVTVGLMALNTKYPGLGVTPEDAGNLVNQGIVLAGSLTSIYARWRATKQISVSAPVSGSK